MIAPYLYPLTNDLLRKKKSGETRRALLREAEENIKDKNLSQDNLKQSEIWKTTFPTTGFGTKQVPSPSGLS